MGNFLIKEGSLKDIEKIKYISERTFYETFFDENTKEDMEDYLIEKMGNKW